MSAAASPEDPRDDPRGATVCQLRDDIDNGRTGDKVAGCDPAAAPLGTDEEAAGTPPDPQLVARMRQAERRMNTARCNGAEPDLTPDGEMRRAGPAWIGALAGAAAAAATVFALTQAR